MGRIVFQAELGGNRGVEISFIRQSTFPMEGLRPNGQSIDAATCGRFYSLGRPSHLANSAMALSQYLQCPWQQSCIKNTTKSDSTENFAL